MYIVAEKLLQSVRHIQSVNTIGRQQSSYGKPTDVLETADLHFSTPQRCNAVSCPAAHIITSNQAVREAATISPRPMQVELRPFDLESGVRVTCDVGYLCANFSLPRLLCSRLRPDVRDRRQTDRCETRIIT